MTESTTSTQIVKDNDLPTGHMHSVQPVLPFNSRNQSHLMVEVDWKLRTFQLLLTHRRHDFATVRDDALQEYFADNVGRIATLPTEQHHPSYKVSGDSTHAPCHTKFSRIQRTNSNGFHEHGRTVNNR